MKLRGLVAAAHTPFKADGSLNPTAVEKQADHFMNSGVFTVFIGGSTGESHSLRVEERMRLAERWLEVARGTRLKVVVHVGSNCIADARALAAHAQKCGAIAVSALTPSYFKPRNVAALVASCADIAAAAPDLPFYFYDIPSLTGVQLSMPDFLDQGRERIANLAGIKWTNPDLYSYQLCLNAPGEFDLPWGNDEYLLAALALGAKGAVGSTYCFAAPLYLRIIKAFERGNLKAARVDQHRSCLLVRTLAGSPCGYMGAAKALMGMLGVPVGPARLPNTNLSRAETSDLRRRLKKIGFFDWGV